MNREDPEENLSTRRLAAPVTPALAAFVSPHGFGHAARTAAVVAELARRLPRLRLELYTTVPAWFFTDSLSRAAVDVVQHAVTTDVGLVQRDALAADAEATVTALERLVPPADDEIARLASGLRSAGVGAVLCDVAALGLAAGRRAGLPTVLVENFTWDWIYRRLPAPPPRLLAIADRLEALYAQADQRLQCAPACNPLPGAQGVAPIARRRHEARERTRERLGVAPGDALVLLTMGGIEWRQETLAVPATSDDGRPLHILTLGGCETPRHDEPGRDGRRIRLPHRSGYHHPDLVAAADAVVGKLGYSTVAEVAAAGVPLGYVTRPDFPESPVLERWVRERLACREVSEAALRAGDLGRDVAALLALERRPAVAADGAAEVADVLVPLLRPGAPETVR